jgi:alkanesulfonate monooxygenase SsuD/methylene tetrahydromethanopterin reductase-like flavin-dependent oxidoreductase (luciferase family)
LTAEADVAPKAMDFIAATNALWDSWDADALIIDQASGLYLDAARVRRVHYKGPYFQVMGPLNAARPPQGYPVLVQSDADPLWAPAARITDVLFVTTPSPDVLVARKAEIARAGGQTRLLAELMVEDASSVAELASKIEGWTQAGLIHGVHLAPTAPEAMARVLELIAALCPTGDAPKAACLYARLGLVAPAATLTKKAYA